MRIPTGKKNFFKDATQKSATMVVSGIEIELQPSWPIFEKCSHLREKGVVLMLLKTTRHLGAKAQYGVCMEPGHMAKYSLPMLTWVRICLKISYFRE